MLPDRTLDESFTEFVEEVEPRLKRALCVGFGLDAGLEATSDALAYGWEHWERVRRMENPAGYLYQVGRSQARSGNRSRPVFPAFPVEQFPWVEPGLPRALGRLTEQQRSAVWLVHGFEWTLGEAAQVLGVSVSTVRKHLERGERKLRRALGVQI